MNRVSLTLLAAWALWCALHSLLIATRVTGFFEKLLGGGFRFYRMAYCLFSVVTLVPLVVFTVRMDQISVWSWSGYSRVVPVAGLVAAMCLFLAGGRHFDLAELLGIRQLATGAIPRGASKGNQLDTSGVLSVIRHPWYTATFLLLWSQDLTRLGLQVNALLSAYLVVGTLLEERKLVETFGDAYRDYRRRVSMFLPAKWLCSRISGRKEGVR